MAKRRVILNEDQIPDSAGGVGEAPIDGNQYVRSDATWENFIQESAFTPTLTASGLSFTYIAQSAVVKKIGMVLFFRIQINFSATGTPAGGSLKINGIPSGFRGAPSILQYLPVLKFQNSGYVNEDVSRLVGEINGNVDGISIVFKNSSFAPLTTYTNTSIHISGIIQSS
tara:strand:- start:33 stop:542 length:510 start_codon:yes stop_codon:yes gene_type:complete